MNSENMDTSNMSGGESRAVYNSPIGVIEILANERGVGSLKFLGEESESPSAARPSFLDLGPGLGEPTARNAFTHLKQCLRELDEYFRGERCTFSVPLDLHGGKFHRRVWKYLMDIPCGETRSYGQIAADLDNPNAQRAVGQANNKNRLAVIIPCHRVIGSDGDMTGYAYGVWRKEWLLSHEKGMNAAGDTARMFG